MIDNGTQVTSAELSRLVFFEEDASPDEVDRNRKELAKQRS